MAARPLSTTLAISFAATTLVVFALVGTTLYVTLGREIRQQDDLDIVLNARHTRRLAEELRNSDDLREHALRLTSQVLGNPSFAMEIVGQGGVKLIEHNSNRVMGTSLAPVATASRLDASQRITEADVSEWRGPKGLPVRGLATDARLGDGSRVTVVIARDMTDRWRVLDHYRERLYGYGLAGVLLAFLISWLLARAALQPLRDLDSQVGAVTIDKLDTRIEIEGASSEVEIVARSLNSMIRRLHDGFERISQYTADLAHDMRTPLGNLRGATEVALARPRSVPEYEALLESNLEECARLSKMIENVIFLSRAEHPQFMTAMEEFDVVIALTQIADYFEGLSEEAGVNLRVTGEGRVRADKELFRRAVSNLLANALRYTPPGGEITLRAEPTATAVAISVHNPGPQIDAALLERIFDRFYRADASRHITAQASGSAGLGLAIVRTIMTLHGGTAHAESDATGTRFVLSFPRH